MLLLRSFITEVLQGYLSAKSAFLTQKAHLLKSNKFFTRHINLLPDFASAETYISNPD